MGIELTVPEELRDLMDEWKVCTGCRDACISSVFKAKRAIYYGKQAEKANRKFWAMAHELYPEMKEGKFSYSFKTQTINRIQEQP
jgi:hypothetical protein